MIKPQIILSSLLLLTVLFMVSCKDDDPEIPNEEEVITTLIYTLTPDNGDNPVVFRFQDLDGDGGDAPVVTEAPLSANQTYTGVIQLLNEQGSTPEDISLEVKEEDEEHQFFFAKSAGLDITYNDQDGNGNPLGLNTTLTTSDAGSETLKITLRHEPDKSATDVADGVITNAGGETDIEVSFNVNVQ